MTRHRNGPLLARWCALLLLGGLLWLPLAARPAMAPEEAMQVGGDMTTVTELLQSLQARTAELRTAVAAIVAAAPGVGTEVARALEVVGRGEDRGRNAFLGLCCLLLMALSALGWRVATRRWRQACRSSTIKANGSLGLLALDAVQIGIAGVVAYLAIQIFFGSNDLQALMLVALLAGVVRWRVFMLFVEAVVRPELPAFRLIAMSDTAARRVKRRIGAATLVGLLGVSVLPVLLRAGLPMTTWQCLLLGLGLWVAVACTWALLAYAASHPHSPARRMWLWLAGIGIPLALLTWAGSVVTREFAAHHSLMYTLRIMLFWYLVHAMLGFSAGAVGWYRLVQHATNAAAALALGIVLSELWLVERLGLIGMARWLPIRHSLETTAITLFVGFVAWRYLDTWTEERLRAASPGLAPGIDDEVAAEPASRLTTLLPLVRVLAGVGIVLVVAFLGLSQLGVDVTTLLAGAGVFGLALSFGSQALVRDIVSGVFFMSDDAFRVGEYIDTGRLKGTVERVTLRSVRLRHQNGQIHTIPFGQLNAITNYSRDWQTVKFNLRLALNTDLERARKTVKRVGQEFLQDPEYGKEFLLPLKLQGMADITESAIVVRLKFTVRPSNPSVIQREALKRLHRAFAQDGIEFAAGVVTVKHAGDAPLPLALAGAAALSASSGTPDRNAPASGS